MEKRLADWEIAYNDKTPAEILIELAKHEDEDVRWCVAKIHLLQQYR